MKFVYGKQDMQTAARAQENCYLLTNGLGGFSSLTAAFSVTRSDHGILIAARIAPNDRVSLVHRLSEGGFPIEANTLYPLLRRLESQGLLESRWETGEAKPRKYYNITPEGTAVLQEASAQWGILTDNVRTMMEVQEHE